MEAMNVEAMHIKDVMREAVLTPLEVDTSSKRYLLSGVLWLAVMVALIMVNYWLVHFFYVKANYLKFYLNYGYLISLGFTLVTLIIDLDQNRDLISSHPFRYANACLHLIRVPLWMTVGAESKHDATGRPSPPEIGPDSPEWNTPASLFQSFMTILDQFLSGFFSIIFILLVSIWLWLVAPLQYFVYLICGAPARVIGKSNRRIWSSHDDAGAPVAGPSFDESRFIQTETEVDYFTRPVRMTSVLAVAVLWALSKAI